jgi:hypothetical protein
MANNSELQDLDIIIINVFKSGMYEYIQRHNYCPIHIS